VSTSLQTERGLAVRSSRSPWDTWLRVRDRILASPRFQRWAAWFPLTRPIARRRASTLFDLCAGFVYSQVLFAAVRLRLFERLAVGPASVTELAAALSLPVDGARRLLAAAAALDLVERRGDDRYGLGIHGAAFLGNPGAAAMVEHHALLYRDLADPVALLRGERTTELQRFWSYAAGGDSAPADVAEYSRLMDRSLSLLAEDVLEAYPFARHRCLLDVGGGEGGFLAAVAARAPELSLVLFDLPAVAARAKERLANAGLASRARVVGGDMMRGALPEGADLATLVRVVHDHDDAEALALLRAVRRSLQPGGALLVAEPMAGTRGAEAMGDAYFGFYLLAMGQGRPRTAAELRSLLLAAGFSHVKRRATRRPMLTGLLVAHT